MPKVRILACNSGNGGDDRQPPRSSGVVVGAERIDSDTEFVILASSGVWEVRRDTRKGKYSKLLLRTSILSC